MSDILLKTRCDKGHIYVYEDKVVVGFDKAGFDRSETIMRNQISGIDIKTTHPAIMGMGGASNVNFNTTGDKTIVAKMVKPKDAKQIRTLLAL